MSGALQAVYQNFRSFLASPKYIKTSTSSSFAPIPVGLAVDSTGNSALLLGYSFDASSPSSYSGFLYNQSDSLGAQAYAVYRNKLSITAYYCCNWNILEVTYAIGISVDSSSNYYVLASVVTGGPTRLNATISAYNSTGTLSWQRVLTYGTAATPANCVTTDSSNNVYVNGQYSLGQYLAKYNSSGTLQWIKLNQGITSGNTFVGMATDSSNNVYIFGQFSTGCGARALVAKFNSSGTLLSQAGFGPSSGTCNAVAGNIDSSGNVYLACLSNISGTSGPTLIKLNSSLTFQWAQKINSSYATSFRKPAFDGSGNIYVSSGPFFAKYNSSGTLQFQRFIEFNGSPSSGNGTETFVVGNSVYFGGQPGSGVGGVTLVVPTDGSATGTYSVGGITVKYSVNGPGTPSTPSISSATPSVTSATDTSLSDSAGSFGQYTAVSTTNTTVTI